jgi:hypothetical protein
MKRTLVVFIILSLFCKMGYAFRCGNHLLDVDSARTDFIMFCGEPTARDFDTLVYYNFEGTGMTYTIYFHPGTHKATRIEEERKG